MLRTIAVFLLAWCATLVAERPAIAEDHLVKVFVVADPSKTGGRLPTLRSIAESTLRDPRRAGEIFGLNQGLAQPDGGALSSPDDRLQPGWILRLPPDAAGPGVRLARDNGGQAPPEGEGSAAPSGTVISLPLPAVLAVAGSILLALVTAAIVARRRVARWIGPGRRAVRAFGAPVRRRRLLAHRRSLGRWFAADGESVRRAYETVGEAAATAVGAAPVHAVRVDQAGATVWLPAPETLGGPWRQIDSTRWQRPSGAAPARHRGTPVQLQRAEAGQASACLVRVGTEADGAPVFVDLSHLDGVLCVTGDRTVAHDVVRHMLSEIARLRPAMPVTVLPTAAAGSAMAIPAGLHPVPPAGVSAPAAADMRGPVRGVAACRPVRGLAVMTGAPNEREAAELLALCGTGGAGWTGLVCGDVNGAHWRWHAGADGRVDLPVLGVAVTAPA